MAAGLVFLGRLEDAAGCGQLACDAGPSALVLAGLPEALREALGSPRIKIAVNGALVVKLPDTVADGDEIAFLPPVSGG